VLDGELLRAARSAEPLSLLLCDVDHFKRYNDNYGHAEGDACLAQVASALAAVARRPADLAARWGGEEFALVLPGTDTDGAIVLAEKLRQGVRDLAIDHAHNDGRGCVTVSVGVATVTGAWTRRELVELTDGALYAAKGRGRDCHAAVCEEHAPASVGRAGT
jgi:two-component system chemotaxis family response regulator WspR